MMNNRSITIFLFLSIGLPLLVLTNEGCVHDPFPIKYEDEIEQDTDTMVVNPPLLIDSTGVPCDSTMIYFEKDVKPIVSQNCAISGCHGGGTYQDGINLESYDKMLSTGKIKPFDLSSKFLKVLTTTKASDVMPPPPMSKLSATQINILSQWISQGAKNETCNPNYGKPLACKVESSTYSGFVKKTVDTYCIGCHRSSNLQGGVNLDGYDNLINSVKSGKFYASIAWISGTSKMPFNGAQLDTCTLNKIKYWIDNGAKNN